MATNKTNNVIRKTENIETYTLLALMNIRKAPSLTAEKIGTAKAGTLVKVRQIKEDWMHLANGSFILFGNGKYAKKM